MIPLDDLDGRIGEAWSGDVPNGSHINVVLARRGSATAAAAVGALASPRPGILPFLACLSPGSLVRPVTIVVNKSPVGSNETLDRITWGAAQIGIAQGMLDAVADDILDAEQVDEIVVLIAVWVDPEAHDETAVKRANRAATRAAVEDAVRSHDRAEVDVLVVSRDAAANAYYTGD